MAHKRIYLASFLFGFISCWFLFGGVNLSTHYRSFVECFTYRRILYLIFCLLFIVLLIVINDTIKNFIETTRNRRKFLIGSVVFTIVAMLSIYSGCEKYVSDWRMFTIHQLNYMLYIFAWYSLIKAFKVWRKYGNFYTLLEKGIIKKYLTYIFVILLSINVFLYFDGVRNFTMASGILSASTCCLSFFCLLSTIIYKHSKKLQQKVSVWKKETEDRIANGDTPKEVSLAYDQMTLVSLSTIITKRVLDTTRATDFQFIISKVFKIVCYSISLITTCRFTGQMKKMSRTLTIVGLFLIFILSLAYSTSFHSFLVKNPDIDNILCKVIDFAILPIGTIKAIVQIITIILAKKATAISINYFIIGCFFSIVTPFNLMVKGSFQDSTITMTLYKFFLYLTIVFLALFFSYKENKKSKNIK